MIARIFAAFLALGLCAAQAKIPGGTGTTYYVSPAGSNSNAGTSPSAPWLTLAKVNTSTFNAGDSILFQGGATFTGTLTAYAPSVGGHFNGTAANPITIGSYGAGRATLVSSGNSTVVIDIYDTAGIIVRDLVIRGTGAASTSTGISIFSDLTTPLNFIYMTNLDISLNSYGIGSGTGSDTVTTGVLIENVSLFNSILHDNNTTGFLTYGALSGAGAGRTYPHLNYFLRGNLSYNNAGTGGVACGHGFALNELSTATVEYNTAHDNGSNCSGATGFVAYETQKVIFQFNESYSNKTNGSLDGDGIDCDVSCSQCTIQYNYIHDNQGSGILLFQGVGGGPTSYEKVARYNVLQNNNQSNITNGGEIRIQNASGNQSNVQVYGNVVYNNIASTTRSLMQISDVNTNGISISNNIFYSSSLARLIFAPNNPTASIFGNDYFSTGTASFNWNGVNYTTLAAWQAAIATAETYRGASVGFTSDPMLTSPGGGSTYTASTMQSLLTAYKLQAGSAMLNAGQNLQKLFGIQPGLQDFYGNIVPAPSNGNYDVGANQRTQ